MKALDLEAVTPEWLSQLANPAAWQEWFKQQQIQGLSVNAIGELSRMIDPKIVSQLQNEYTREFSTLCQETMAHKPPVVSDKRFSGSVWQSNTYSAFNAAAYLLNSRFLMALADNVDAPARVKQKVKFAVQQMIDAMSPANFLATNPEAQQKLVETNGESLTKGIVNMLVDIQKGRISQSDESAFQVGKNVAATEGDVVYENDLIQLIQYKPRTETVYQRPLLIVPPCINKFYILDLQPDNSLVNYAVRQGHTVFLVSWGNPDTSLGGKTWDNYIDDAAIEAIHAVQEISGQEQINTLGFCVGGTILSTALAVLAARGEHPASSMTLLTSLLDFTDTGIVDVFIDEAQVVMREQSIGRGGLMPGRDFASAFSSLRSNDLIWSYVKSNYLKGEFPPAFDLLYWNADSTNLPGTMFCWYLRNLYLENSLRVPGKLTVAGAKVDLGSIDVPTYIYASREDHIVPWTSGYVSTQLLNPDNKSKNRFIMGASGHIAGVINPPTKNKRSYWSNAALPDTPQEWFEGATEHPGSWWPTWDAFLVEHAGKQVKAPSKAGSKKYRPIEAAPGRYVKVKAE